MYKREREKAGKANGDVIATNFFLLLPFYHSIPSRV